MPQELTLACKWTLEFRLQGYGDIKIHAMVTNRLIAENWGEKHSKEIALKALGLV